VIDSNETEVQEQYRKQLSPLLEHVYAVAKEAERKREAEEKDKADGN
jgi:hypothetical protein